jgi:preprotein translocase subunit SecD
MQIQPSRFNIYLACLLTLGMACGCQSPEKKREKKLSFLRVHMEAQNPIKDRTPLISVFRAAPTQMYVEPRPFVTEESVKDAKVVDTMGGFALRIELDRSGRHLLEQYTSASANKTRRLAIFSRFADPAKDKAELERWLGAPMVSQAITNGVLTFTPDASREEAEQIAVGLQNVAKKLGTGKEPW